MSDLQGFITTEQIKVHARKTLHCPSKALHWSFVYWPKVLHKVKAVIRYPRVLQLNGNTGHGIFVLRYKIYTNIIMIKLLILVLKTK